MFIYDNGPEPKVLEFNLDGSFIRKIGGMGGSKSEYLTIDDITINPYEKKVLVLYYNKIKIYDYEGKFQKEVELDKNEPYNYKIESVKNGYVMSTRYEGFQYLVQLYDKDFQMQKRMVHVGKKRLTCNAPCFGRMSLDYDGKNVYFYDAYDSKFYIFNPENPDSLNCYSIKDENLLTFEKVEDADKKHKDLDCDEIFHGFCTNNKSFGCYIIDHSFGVYIYDFANKKYDVYRSFDWLPNLIEYRDGYYYAILSAEDVINIKIGLNTYPDQRPYQIFEDAVSKFKEPLTLESNYVLVRMKLKEK